LSPLMESVNMVNAPVIAKERDINVSEVKHERDGAYQTLIKLTVETEKQSRSISGTIFAGSHPRIVEIKDIPIDAELGPNMLFITNRDKPGFIGSLGMILGDANINIATFHLGRATAGGDAIALIEVDEAPGEAVMDDICKLEQVVRVKALTF
jgi:D-3-phosphoglycerate dehydrogenase